MNELHFKNMNIMFNKINNLVKLNKYSEREIKDILSKDIEFMNASLVICVISAIKYEISKVIKEYGKGIK